MSEENEYISVGTCKTKEKENICLALRGTSIKKMRVFFNSIVDYSFLRRQNNDIEICGNDTVFRIDITEKRFLEIFTIISEENFKFDFAEEFEKRESARR